MTKLITLITLFIASLVSAQGNYEKSMQEALALWKTEKPAEAIAKFERIAAAETNKWLPNYYIALINTTEGFANATDKNKFKALLEAAQIAQDKVNAVAPENPEVLVLQAMLHTAWIVYDPMTNGQSLSGVVMSIYEKAIQIAPENPRVVFNKANFEKGMASYFGQDTTEMCGKIKKSIELFANFKPETSLHPVWGLEQAKEAAAKCN